jgi:hypothetical protein
MPETKPTVPKVLFKYIHQDRIEDVIERLLIRFTPPSEFNDPFDAKPAIALPKFKTLQAQRDQMREAIYFSKLVNDPGMSRSEFVNRPPPDDAHAKAIFEKQAQEFQITATERQVETFSQRFGILALAEEATSIVMWSHYSDKHCGFVIEFDTAHDFFGDESKRPGLDLGTPMKVRYQDQRPIMPMDCESVRSDVWQTKSSAWEYEKEWRIIRPFSEHTSKKERPDGLPPIYLFSLPGACVRRIIIGAKMGGPDIKRLGDAMKNPALGHVVIERAEEDLNEFRLNCVPFKFTE